MNIIQAIIDFLLISKFESNSNAPACRKKVQGKLDEQESFPVSLL